MSFQCLAVVLLSLVSLSYSQPPYLVSISRTGPFENNIILRCQVAATGLTVSGAVFTRNGALFHQDEECLQKIATDSNNGILNLNLTANCEGYYQCGEAGNGNRFELSGSTIVYAYPEQTTSINRIEVTASVGDDVTLLCPVQVSALNQFTVTWMRINQAPETLQLPINDDYSLTLPNVTTSDSGNYFCRVSANELPDFLLSTVIGYTIDLRVTIPHVSPELISNITYSKGTNNRNLFRVTARGTQPLTFLWYLNNKVLEGSIERELSLSNNGFIVVENSEIELQELPRENSELTVVILNRNSRQQVFSESLTSFILSFSIEEDDESEDNNNNNDDNSNDNIDDDNDDEYYDSDGIDNQDESNKEDPSCESETTVSDSFAITVSILSSLVAVLLIIIIVLVVIICICYSKIKPKYCCKCGCSDPHGQRLLSASSINTPPESIVPYTESPKHYRSLTPFPLDPDQCPNPVCAILLQVAYLYWNNEPSESILMRSLHHVLADVLEDRYTLATSHPETLSTIKQLRDKVTKFGDDLRERRLLRRQYTRQSTETTTVSSDISIQMQIMNDVVDETDDDQVDGDCENCENTKVISDIREMLDKWLDNARKHVQEKEKEKESD